MSSFAAELEATNQKTETRCTNIRKEVSKALSEQRQLLTTQSEAMTKKMDSVATKVPFSLFCPSVFLSIASCFPSSVCLSVYLSVCLYLEDIDT